VEENDQIELIQSRRHHHGNQTNRETYHNHHLILLHQIIRKINKNKEIAIAFLFTSSNCDYSVKNTAGKVNYVVEMRARVRGKAARIYIVEEGCGLKQTLNPNESHL